MKIYLPNYDKNAIGGGWSFIANFRKAMGDAITDNYAESDIFFLPSASMVSRDDVEQARRDGKKIVIRCDNIIRNSRNRNTGMSRMKDFSDWADLVIFQSNFACDLLNQYLHTENYNVILNSVDEKVFCEGNRTYEQHRYYYGKHSSDETKNWEMARIAYQEIAYQEPTATFNLVGRYDTAEYNFDFYNNENFKYWGYVTDPAVMANIYRVSDRFIYTYFNDACSNSVIEALCCGVDIFDPYTMAQTGGTPEILKAYSQHGTDYFKLSRMGDEYRQAMGKL